MEISQLIGQTLSSVTVYESNDEIIFITTEGKGYRMYHCQECCENVEIEDISGDLNDLVGAPILQAEESINEDEGPVPSEHYESFTWTFYKLATVKGYVTIRWLGESNGFYSEGVDFVKLGY